MIDKFHHRINKKLKQTQNKKTKKKKIKKKQTKKKQTKSTLASLYNEVSAITDKGTTHSYIDYYEELFKPYRNKKINLLEIGVFKGGSLILWSKYFTESTIYGIDTKRWRRQRPDIM